MFEACSGDQLETYKLLLHLKLRATNLEGNTSLPPASWEISKNGWRVVAAQCGGDIIIGDERRPEVTINVDADEPEVIDVEAGVYSPLVAVKQEKIDAPPPSLSPPPFPEKETSKVAKGFWSPEVSNCGSTVVVLM